MIASQNEIRARIDQLRLSYEGYKRQLARPGATEERRARLQSEVEIMGEEIATLEKLAQLSRLEPDRGKVEAAVRERLGIVREALGSDPSLGDLSDQERDLTSGEARAFVWALGEDAVTQGMQEMLRGHERHDPTRTERALPRILAHRLEEAPDVDTRASAAYDIGQLRIASAIPSLAAALQDDPFVAEVAMRALSLFSDEELRQASLSDEQIARIRHAPNAGEHQ